MTRAATVASGASRLILHSRLNSKKFCMLG